MTDLTRALSGIKRRAERELSYRAEGLMLRKNLHRGQQRLILLMTREQIIRDLKYLQLKIDMIIKALAHETGPENSREEVAPMGRNTTRDWCMGRLAAAS